ncbi:hypothetical protein [Proteus vulgaris]|uniref:Uncharacterized protein n=1 Tax=Proteus vulgaris TaxID=585 RepID=A0A6G6SJI6_PROVU|nr:hypothetical protein [Proteus vulgaris]QIF94888.1 hypothetical protein GTH24_13730 [Proteus vulgaris]WIF71170.1 hypothetical protein QN092_14455 [Proteus vulgaris]CRL62058.1 hypothetical protein BN1805_01564 [Proteus vulgaris]
MLPFPIVNFVKQLITETQNKEIQWRYISDDDTVKSHHQGRNINLNYAFDYNQEISVYRLNIEQTDGRIFFFAISEYDAGYTLLKQLYNEAQASDFDF